MSEPIPDWVHKARKPQEIIDAAGWLREHAADTAAVEPLARLSRVAPGYGLMLGGLVVFLLAFLAGGWLVFQALAYGYSTLGLGLAAMTETFYPEWFIGWWIAWAALAGLWFWRDGRLLGLLSDPRFELPEDALSRLWVAVLWPVRALAMAARLAGALFCLAPLLALPLFALWTLAGRLQDPRLLENPDYAVLMQLGLAAAGLLLAFGLFVFSSWPRAAPESGRAAWWTLPLALLLGAGLGWLVWRAEPAYGPGPGVASGLFFAALFNWFLGRRARRLLPGAPVPRSVQVTSGQRKFMAFLLGLYALVGVGAVVEETVRHWRVLGALPLLDALRHLELLAPELAITGPEMGAGVLAGALGALALMYLSGLGIALARPLAWPFFILRAAALNLMLRLRARQVVRLAVRHHRRRNQEQVAGRGEQAVCRQDLARFERRTTFLSYSRPWTYWQCRLCHSDQHAVTGVRVLRGVFDQGMEAPLVSEDSALNVNMLRRTVMPLDLDEIAVRRLDEPKALELFAVEYDAFRPPVKIPRPQDIVIRLGPEAVVDENTLRLLRGSKFKVERANGSR